MSADNIEADNTSARCASCGVAENDGVKKLKNCTACYLVRYCSDECMENHKSEHAEDCQKRAAELRDELLFKQPESSHMGDCPICSLPLPLDIKKSNMYECCSKLICKGCEIANQAREYERSLQLSCPFCREPIPKTDEERDKQRMKRIRANDPDAMCQEGSYCYNKGDYSGAFEYFTKAAALGHAKSHYGLSILYDEGQAIEEFKGKKIYHLEEAAIGGHPDARHRLGVEEWQSDSVERAVKHWIIAATQGLDASIEALMKIFREGYVEKEVLAAALRAHKAAVDATRSPLREAAEAALRQG